jgi:hypothetical protein
MRLRGNRFRVVGRLDMASRPIYGTVVIERATAEADLFHVRPLRRRRVYTLPLSTVAEMVVRAIVVAEVRERRAARKRGRRGV